MQYINKYDLTVCIQNNLLEDNTQANDTILDNIETETIALAAGYLAGRYDTTRMFATPPVRNGVLVQIISAITVYRVVRRNAARKVPEDYHNLYTDAIRLLERIQAGSLALEGCPAITAPDGSTGKLMYGNTTNPDFFI